MPDVFLLGGGWNAAAVPSIYRRFVAAAGPDPTVACVILDEPGCDLYARRFVDVLCSAGARQVSPLIVSDRAQLSLRQLKGTDAVFVGGGLTPGYLTAADAVRETLRPWLAAHDLPYAGFSAGAAIASAAALVGGWRMTTPAGRVMVCPEEVSEDLDEVVVARGLALVPFTVDVHAAAWGTLSRLVSVVAAGTVAEGWAIDEDTMLQVSECGDVSVHGLGRAYRVRPQPDGAAGVDVAVLRAGTPLAAIDPVARSKLA